MIRFSSVSALAAVVVVFACPALHAADPNTISAADAESARAAYVEGKALREKGDHAGAVERFKAAFLLAPTPITALELGREFETQRMPVEAREILLSIERMKRRPDESDKSEAARAEAEKLAERLRRVIPSALIRFDEPPVVREVVIDDQVVPKDTLAVARKVNPGRHVVIARGDGGFEARVAFEIAEGENKTVSVKLAPTSSATVTPQVSRPPATSERRSSPAAPIAFGVAGAGVLVGTVTGALAWDRSSVLDDRCVAARCPPDVHSDLRFVDTTATISTIAFAIGLASAVVGTILWLTGNPKASAGGGT